MLTIQEAVAILSNGGWTVDSALDISSAAHAYKQLHKDTNAVAFQSDSEVYIRFDLVITDTISTSNDLKFPANSIHIIPLPKKLKDADSQAQIVVHFKQVTSVASRALRLIEI